MATDATVMELDPATDPATDLEFDTADLGNFQFESMEEFQFGILETQPLPPTSTATAAAAVEPGSILKQITDQAANKHFVQTAEAINADMDRHIDRSSRGLLDERSRVGQFLDHLAQFRENTHAKRELLAEQSVEAHRLKEQHKAAKDIAKETTEELSGMEMQLEELERLWESGEWQSWQPPEPIVPVGSSVAVNDGDSRQTAAPCSESRQIAVDPATTAKIDCLKITPGRLETLEQAECRTVADLERLMRDGGLLKLKGFGAKAIEVVTDKLREWRQKNPMPESLVEKVPLVEGQFDPLQYTAGKTAFMDGVSRSKNPNKPAGGFAWKSWDVGWVDKCTVSVKPVDLIEMPDTSPGATSTTTPAGIEANDTAAIPVDELEPYSTVQTFSIPVAAVRPVESDAATATDPEPTSEPQVVVPDPVDPFADWPEEDLTPELIGAFRAGSDAALEGGKVTANPHKKGSAFWKRWDQGWQGSFKGDEL